MDLEKNLEKILSCPICFEIYDDSNRTPITLKCGHYLCKECTFKLFKDERLLCCMCKCITKKQHFNDFKADYSKVFKDILSIIYSENKNLINKTKEEKIEKDARTAENFTELERKLNFIEDLNSLLDEMNKNKNVWNEIPVRVAFIGKPKTGKSTLINTLRGKGKNFKGDNQKDLAETDVIECTKIVNSYEFDANKNILLCDVPGVGTPDFRKNEEYLNSYDYYVLIITEYFSEEDEWLLNQIKATKKPFTFVYTKLDSVIDNDLKSCEDFNDLNEIEKESQVNKIQNMIREECTRKIKGIMRKEPFKLFLISGIMKNINKFDYPAFNDFMLNNLCDLKRRIMFSALKSLSDKIINKNDYVLRERIFVWKNSFDGLSGFFKTIGVSIKSLFINYLHKFLVDEIKFFVHNFQIDEKNFESNEENTLLRIDDNIKEYLEKLLTTDNYFNSELESEFSKFDTNTNCMKSNVIDSITGTRKIFFKKAYVTFVSEILEKVFQELQSVCAMKLNEEIADRYGSNI